MHSTGCTGNKGFSLVELMIVLVILGVMIAFAGPRVAKGLSGITLKTASKKVAAALRYARSTAISTGQPCRVIFDGERKRVITVATRRKPSADNATEEGMPEDDIEDDGSAEARQPLTSVKHYQVPEQLRFSRIIIGGAEPSGDPDEGIYQLTFFPSGTCNGAEVALTDEDERAYTVAVDYLTGAVSLREETDE